MPISVDCPACLEPLSIPDEYARGAVKCPKCKCLIPPADTDTLPELPLAELEEDAAGGLRVLSTQRFMCGACKEAITPDQPALFCSGATRHKVHSNCAEVLCGGKCPECGFTLVPEQTRRPVARPVTRPIDRRNRPRLPRARTGFIGFIVSVCVIMFFGCCGLGVYSALNGSKTATARTSPRATGATSGPSEPGLTVTAAQLAQVYKHTTTADVIYRDRVLLVEGKLHDLAHNLNDEPMAVLEGVPGDERTGLHVRVVVSKADASKLLALSRGQTVKLKGRCTGLRGTANVELVSGTFESAGPDPSPNVVASELLAGYARDPFATDARYKDNAITVTTAIVEWKEGDAALVVSAGPLGGLTRVRVSVPPDAVFRKQVAEKKIGDRIKIKGEYAGSSNGMININRAWIVP